MHKKILFITNSFYSHFTPFYAVAQYLTNDFEIYWCQINGVKDEYSAINKLLEDSNIKVIESKLLAPKWHNSEINDESITEDEKKRRNDDFNGTFTPGYEKFTNDVQELLRIIDEIKPDLCFTEGSVFAATTAIKIRNIKNIFLNIFYMKPRLWSKRSIFQNIATHLYARRTLKEVNIARQKYGLKPIYEYPDYSSYLNVIPSYEFYIDHNKFEKSTTLFTGPLVWDKGLANPQPEDLENVFKRIKNNNTIYVSLGTTVSDESFFNLIIDAARQSNFTYLLTIGNKNKLDNKKNIPSNVIIKEWFPTSIALDYASAAIIHGGEKSSLTCLQKGVPTIIVPYFGDQYSHADRFSDLKIGLRINRTDMTPTLIIEKLNEILINNSVYKNNIKKYSKIISTSENIDKLIKIIKNDKL